CFDALVPVTLSRRSSRHTVCPSAVSDFTSAVPTNPVAPVTSTFIRPPRALSTQPSPLPQTSHPCVRSCNYTLRPGVKFPGGPPERQRQCHYPQSTPGFTIPLWLSWHPTSGSRCSFLGA